MTFMDDIKAVLVADTGAGGVATLCTGGIFTYAQTGRNGITRVMSSAPFDATTGLLKPCCLVKGREEVPDGGMDDDQTQEVSYRQVVELWFYDDGDRAYTTIESARTRAKVLLHGQMIGSSKFIPHWAGNILTQQRDEALDNALMIRSDFAIRAIG
jgi:hypothetical protein